METNTRLTAEKTSSNPEKKGWLLKWTNYIKGYQRRWFVLSKGVLSYYRNQAEINHTCRGTISLHGALIHTVDSCTFVISNGGTQTFHIKASNEVERQSWVTVLELAKAKAIRAIESEEEEEEVSAQVVPSQEINTDIRDLTARLENLHTCYDLITRHGVALQRALTDLESNEEDLASRTKIVNERATLFRITSQAMINACSNYLRTAESQGHKWSKMLQHEREQRQRLEECVEQLAKQHTQLEQAAHQVQVLGGAGAKSAQNQKLLLRTVNCVNASADGLSTTAVSICSDDDDNEFFDAEENGSFFDIFSSDDVIKLPQQQRQQQVQQQQQQKQQQYRKHNIEEQANTSSSSENEQQHVTTSAATSTAKNNSKRVSLNELTVDSVPLISERVRESKDFEDQAASLSIVGSSIMKRRTTVPEKPNYPLNLWSIMKNCIGKDLSKIPMPVNFNEPLSMLQRLTEDYEYGDLLDIASQAKDECEQLAYVAAFTVTAYSTTANRTGKPFNPLLGETFECDRMADLGWRCFSEQVSHHPPIAAIHCEGRKWTCWQEFGMTSKFRGKYLQVIPLGSAFLQFHDSGRKYTWRKVTTVVNNIIVGKLWVDQQGDAEIKGLSAANGLRAIVKYIPYSYFSRETQRRIKARIIDRNNEVKFVLRGAWNAKIELAQVLETQGDADNPIFKTSGYKTIWQRREPPIDSEKYYNFTLLACQLNEMEEGVAPTDCRLRPDQRLMEEGRWDESNEEKLRLEEKQRAKRRQREAAAEQASAEGRPYSPYEPTWFKQMKDEDTGHMIHVFTGKYWEHKKRQDWSACPDLFGN